MVVSGRPHPSTQPIPKCYRLYPITVNKHWKDCWLDTSTLLPLFVWYVWRITGAEGSTHLLTVCGDLGSYIFVRINLEIEFTNCCWYQHLLLFPSGNDMMWNSSIFLSVERTRPEILKRWLNPKKMANFSTVWEYWWKMWYVLRLTAFCICFYTICTEIFIPHFVLPVVSAESVILFRGGITLASVVHSDEVPNF